MGLAERDYVRQPPRRGGGFGGGFGGGAPGGGGLRPGAFSATTWLIIINIAVFVLGGVLSQGGAVFGFPTQQYLTADAPDSVRVDDSVGWVGRQIQTPDGEIDAFVRPVVDANGQQWGWQSYYLSVDPLRTWGHFSTYTAFTRLEVWRFVSFQFLHADVTHLAFNMIALFFFGPAIERYCGSRRKFLAFYFTAGIFGAFTYLMLNLLGIAGVPLPGVLDYDITTPLIGASAGVFGVVLATAYIAPNSTILLFFVVPLKMKTGAYLMFALSLINLVVGWWNQGGEAAHVGGALAGWYFIRRLHLLDDFFDIFGGGKDGQTAARKGKRSRGGNQRGAARQKRTATGDAPLSKAEEKRLDEILSKVATQGMDALSESEIAFLESARKRKGG
jgi:membrane associated rhomboid family serine protease